MTAQQLSDKTYSSKQSATRAMWSFVNSLQRAGIHTGALSGDNGTSAQWINNNGCTQWASVDHDNNYYTTKWHVNLSMVQNG